jgi:hypothetical protein
MVLGVIAFLGMIVAAQSTQAQCCRLGFRIGDIPCPVRLCIVTHSGDRCFDLNPGSDSVVAIPCDLPFVIGILDVCGNRHLIGPDTCEDNIPLGHSCCVKVCLRHDPDDCFRVTVTRATGPCLCP